MEATTASTNQNASTYSADSPKFPIPVRNQLLLGATRRTLGSRYLLVTARTPWCILSSISFECRDEPPGFDFRFAGRTAILNAVHVHGITKSADDEADDVYDVGRLVDVDKDVGEDVVEVYSIILRARKKLMQAYPHLSIWMGMRRRVLRYLVLRG
jgi:hypothetical protein